MEHLKLGKKDIIWSYIAQFLSMGVGVITLPFILNRLTTAEIGLNYILITVGSVIALVDLGFAPQFARNFSYVFSGAQELSKEGIGKTSTEINYQLLSCLLKTARYIYGILALFALILLLGIGTPYVYKTTDGFSAVPNAQYVWIIYSFGVLFQIFYSYYFSMLLGAGKVKEQKYAIIGNKLLYMAILISGLYLGAGLLSVSIAQLLSPFFGRILAYRFFYSKELKLQLSNYSKIDHKEVTETFKTLWFNAKRTAVMQIGAYAILRFSMFIAGLYLTLNEFASYGLMIQIVGILCTVSCTFMQISQPKFASLRTRCEKERLVTSFSVALIVYYVMFTIGALILIFWGKEILLVIRSNADLPSRTIIIAYCIVMFLEHNHANFSILISSNNKVPFAPASIATGLAVCIGIFIVVRYTSYGILGLVIVQGVCQAAYQNWKWPQMALKEFNLSIFQLLGYGMKSIISQLLTIKQRA
ncbi:MAG: polysaccharide biosynthesis protein [Duncaniella sp.]|nr:polysaccharide biosynthesis protein [Duncaniella sp.]